LATPPSHSSLHSYLPSHRSHLHLHSFPTRRSSDLGTMTQLLQTDDGQIREAFSVSAGLDYPGVGPEHSHLADVGRVEYSSVTDEDRKSTRLNSSHVSSSYAVFCLKKIIRRYLLCCC